MPVSPAPVAHPATELRPLRVLIVDDDGLQLRALQRQLRGNRYVDLAVADNAIDAMLAIGARQPDLVIMDVFMPDLDGVEACRRIKTNPDTRDVPIVLASVVMTPELERQAREAGAVQAVSKPLDVVGLLDALNGDRAMAERPPALETTVRGADYLVAMLEEAGVEIVFGLPGGAISPVHDALLDRNIRVLTARHESGAMFAAAAYARATGKLGVVAVTAGPGILNSMTGLATAWCDGVGLLVLVGEVPRGSQGRGVLQDGSSHGLQVIEIVRSVTKLATEVARPTALPHLLRRGIGTAMSGRRGPVVLTLPLDVTTAQLAPPRRAGSVTARGTVDTDVLDEIASAFFAAERPLILAGSGLRGDGAPARLRALAERLSCPVVTTPKGKGVFPEDHPLALGVVGVGGHRSARRYVETGIDALLAIGTSLGDLSTDGFLPQLQAPTLVHIDIDSRQIGRSFSPTHAVVASATDFLSAFNDRLAERRTRPRAVRGATGGVTHHALPSSSKPDRIAAHDALAEIQELVPADAIYTVDAGEHFVFATHFLKLVHPDSYLVMTGLGSMGPSIGAAIGAQLAHPDRFVAAICGDGCFAMNAFEIATAAAERLPIRVFVFNDERHGMVEIGHQRIYGRTPAFSTAPLDVCAVAAGLGATAIRIDGAGQLRRVRNQILHERGPVVVDVRIDPEIFLPRIERISAMVVRGVQRGSTKVVN